MKKTTMVKAIALAAIAITGLAVTGTSAIAGPTTYSVDIAPNGVGGCINSTGGLTNVTQNPNATPITIQCATPNGYAWGRNLDTPDASSVDANVVDDGTTLSLGWNVRGQNSSRGRALGLGLKIGNTSVKSTSVTFFDPTGSDSTAFEMSYDNVTNGLGQTMRSLRPNLALKLARVPWLQSDGNEVRCKGVSETAGITWTAGIEPRPGLRNYTAKILVDCSGIAGASSQVNKPLKSSVSEMTNVSTSTKLMTNYYQCTGNGGLQDAVAGGYDISASTTSQWPQVVFNGPDPSDSSIWRVTVAVPSQNSAANKASLYVYATCKNR